MVLPGRDVRFVATVECDHVLRVGDRTGRVLPAHRAPAARRCSPRWRRTCVAAVLGGARRRRGARLGRELRTIRRRGYAVNDQATETGLTAVGVALPAAPSLPPAALSVAMPTARFSADRPAACHAALDRAAAAIGRDLEPAR